MIRRTIRPYALIAELVLIAALLMGLAPGARAEETVIEPEEVAADRILNIYKTTEEAGGKLPLPGIQIDIYRVAAMEELAEGGLELSPQPSREETRQFMDPENLVTTLTTDVQGFATYNFTQNGDPDGAYLVAEQFDPATTGAVDPFYIFLPTQSGEPLEVHLKGTLETGPNVNLDVISLDNESGSFAVGQPHTWILRGSIPAGLSAARSYVLNHVLDSRLSLEEGILVNLHNKEGKQLTLRAREHYLLEQSRGIDHKADRLRLDLTPAGMTYVAENLGEGEYPAELRLSFRACINRTADMGTTIPGHAELSYTNSAGACYEAGSDSPEVHTGGIHIAVTDGSHEPLAGATFRLAKLAEEGEMLYIDGEKRWVTFAAFFTSADMQGKAVTEMTTGPDGRALAYGLPYGNYYLVETEAPDRYNRVTVPIPAAVNEVSHLTRSDGWQDMEEHTVDNTITVINTKFILPETGGMGMVVFAMIGLGMIGAACMMLLPSRRRL